MAAEKKAVVIYTNWITTFEKLSDEEAGRLVKHMFRYINDLDPEPPDRLTELVFEPYKQILKIDLQKYEAIREKRRLAGSMGGAPKGNTNAGKKDETSKTSKRLKKQTKQTVIEKVTVTDKVLPKGNNKLSAAKATVSLHAKCKDVFHDKFRGLFGEEYYWEAKDAANLNPVIKKITHNRESKSMPVDDDSIVSAFNSFLESITDKWILANFSMPNINSKFNEIISQAKNGRKQQTSDNENLAKSVAAGIARAKYERDKHI